MLEDTVGAVCNYVQVSCCVCGKVDGAGGSLSLGTGFTLIVVLLDGDLDKASLSCRQLYPAVDGVWGDETGPTSSVSTSR